MSVISVVSFWRYQLSMEERLMKWKIIVWILIASFVVTLPCCSPGSGDQESIIFGMFAENSVQLNNVLLMVESIRTFAGKHQNAPIWIYIPEELMEKESETLEKFTSFGVEVKTSEAPEDATWFFFARKVFAAATAEAEAEGETAILAWLDEDTIVLDEPGEFILPKGKNLGYRPVMHKNIGVLYTEAVDAFWSRAYERMSVLESSLFPMVTPADGDTIRPYFNAGCMVVRPKLGILRKWADNFTILYQDSALTNMCKQDIQKRIFIHQAALTGAILNNLKRNEMVEFSARINYPLFFEERFGAKREFNDISNVVTIRHESYFRNPSPDWYKRLEGPKDKIAWMKNHLDGK